MNTGVDTELVKETYERMSDEELVRIATKDASGLTPEAICVMKAEIRKRNLDIAEAIIAGVEAQNRDYSPEEIAPYCDILCNLPCPTCGGADVPLNATKLSEVISMVFVTQYKTKLKVACPTCLDKANDRAMLTTAVLGWWGLPWGIIRTVQALHQNVKSKQLHHVDYHNEHLCNFVLTNIGTIEAYKEDEERLRLLLVQHNKG